MNERRLKLIAELLKHLEEMDANELGEMAKPKEEVAAVMVEGEAPPMAGDAGPMEKLAEGSAPMPMDDEDDLDDDEDWDDDLPIHARRRPIRPSDLQSAAPATDEHALSV